MEWLKSIWKTLPVLSSSHTVNEKLAPWIFSVATHFFMDPRFTLCRKTLLSLIFSYGVNTPSPTPGHTAMAKLLYQYQSHNTASSYTKMEMQRNRGAILCCGTMMAQSINRAAQYRGPAPPQNDVTIYLFFLLVLVCSQYIVEIGSADKSVCYMAN